MANVGDTKVNKITGQKAVFDGQNWRLVNSSGQTKINNSLEQNAMNDYTQANQNSASALGNITQQADLINALESGKVRTGFGTPTIQKFGLGSPQERTYRKQIDIAGSQGTLEMAKNLKPLSNSDIQWAAALNAGLGSGKQENVDMLRAQQWANAKMLGKTRAQERWINKFGGLTGKSPTGQNFDSWWATQENKLYPRPVINGKGSYIPPSGKAKASNNVIRYDSNGNRIK